MRTLAGRIGAALLVFAVVTLLTLGGALWVALRDLHRDAALGSLAELTVPYASQARQRVPLELLRSFGRGGREDREAWRAFRESREGQVASEAFESFVEDAQDEIEAAGISVLLVADGSTVVRDPASGAIATLDSAPRLIDPGAAGAVTTGTTVIDGIGEVLYAATPIREPLADRSVPTLMLAREDDSARLATGDLVRALAIAGVVLTAIGVPLAVGLSRSVSGPLGRLAAASDAVASGHVPAPLPTTGPLEVAEASTAFNAMAAEVDATRQAQRQLLADVRHDLRTPLTVIAGFAEALRDGTASGPAADRAAAAIADEAGRLERMLTDLDHLAMPGTEGPPLHIQPLAGLELARATVDRFATEAASRGQSLSLADGSERAASLTFAGDRDAIDRILGNIVANAMTHAPSPGGHIRIQVVPVAPSDPPLGGPGGWTGQPGVVLAVHDDGPGIPAAALPHVFDRFYRADPARASRGSGLGLAIVRDLADALGGRAFAESPRSGGARVGVVLPLASAAAPPVRDQRGSGAMGSPTRS
jgi:signal transduction histidine kinase